MLDLPDSPLTPFVLRNCARLGAKPALVDSATGRAIAHAELPGEIDAAAGALARAGHAPGDVVGVVLPNMPEFAVVFHAVLQRGGVVTPVNPALTPAEMGRQLDAARARYVITSPELAPAVSEASGAVRVLLVGTPDLRGPAFAPEPSAPGDLAALPYSSGTTGFPKGVMLTHRNLSANVVQVERVFRCGEDDVLLARLAVLPHLRVDREHEPRAGMRGDGRDDGSVRPGGVPGDDRAPPGDPGLSRAADHGRACQAPAGRPPRPLIA
jgi:acyl-CoA synthetase (AMP-forming)/AMP-acid ligase II